MQTMLPRPRLMDQAATKILDPAQFASSVRQIAQEVHRVLNDPLATHGQLVELSRRIDALLKSSPGARSCNMNRWLRNVEDLVDAKDSQLG